MPDANCLGWLPRSTRRCVEDWFDKEARKPDPHRRVRSHEIAGTLKLTSRIGPIALAAHDPCPSVREAACRSLAVLDPQAAVGALLGAIEGDDAWAPDLLQAVVARAGPVAWGPVLERFRLWATRPNFLGVMACVGVGSQEPLFSSALGSSDETIVERAIDILAQSDHPDDRPTFVMLLNSPSERVRLASIKALQKTADPESLREVMLCLGDPSRPVRFAAASAVALHPAGRHVLERLERSGDAAVAEAANLGLSYLDSERSDAGGFKSPAALALANGRQRQTLAIQVTHVPRDPTDSDLIYGFIRPPK
jgi:HEAT repeat protein